jgi:catechol 2,3-dioxygenase-like lactoylglutathione lyase family enzyme
MLGDKTAVATIAVKDMDAAKKFYEGTLGLKPAEHQDEGGLLYKSGDSNVFVYQSQFAGTNQATTASWAVGDDIEKVVEELKAKGVKFEQYDGIPGVKREGEIHIAGDGKLKAAWFKDPDGNILNLVNGM